LLHESCGGFCRNRSLVGLISEYRLSDVDVVALLNPDSTTGPDARRHSKNLLRPHPFRHRGSAASAGTSKRWWEDGQRYRWDQLVTLNEFSPAHFGCRRIFSDLPLPTSCTRRLLKSDDIRFDNLSPRGGISLANLRQRTARVPTAKRHSADDPNRKLSTTPAVGRFEPIPALTANR
jgi:hypothetical protein